MEQLSRGHDIVAVGASAGGIEVVEALIAGLPSDLPAAVFVVIHVGEVSNLAPLLDRAGPMPVSEAVSGEPIERGRVYVAAPGSHMLLHDQHVLLRRGPRENLARPAIDPLFRSAAATFGGRVIGAVLSGSLSDGTAGLRAIKRCGGLAVVQDPADAAFPSMPGSAERHVAVDHVVKAADLATVVGSLVGRDAGPTPEIPFDIRLETMIAAQELTDRAVDDELGSPSGFTCPECQGALWEIQDGDLLRYRCHVGHAFTSDSVLEARSEEVENLLDRLLRSHQERAALARRLLQRERQRGPSNLLRHLESRVADYEDGAEIVRRLVWSPGRSGDTTSVDQSGERDPELNVGRQE